MTAVSKTHLLLPALACALLAAGCGVLTTTGSERLVTKAVAVEPFSSIEVGHGFDLHLSPGATEKVTVQLDDNLVDDMEVGVSDGTLRLRMGGRRAIRDASLHADVVVPSVTSIRADGGAKVHLADGFSLGTLGLNLSGGSSVDGAVRTQRIDLGMSGGSRATLSGTASGLDVAASGGSAFDGGDLRVKDAEVRLSGGARVTTSVSDTISADLSGASSLTYVGSPSFVRRDVSGNSSITNG